MKKQTLLLSFLFMTAFFSCQPDQGSKAEGEAAKQPESFDPGAYLLQDVPGSTIKRAERRDSTGQLLETGFLDGAVRTGTWTTYFPDTGFPWTQVSMINGKYNGLYLEYTSRGQINLMANYKDNKLHGFWGKYHFSRPEIIANYKDGKLDGIYRKYYQNKTQIQEEIQYRAGEIDGKYRFYNEKGQMVMEYDYKNGKKVGGGAVEVQ